MKDDALIDANIIDVLKRIESVSDNKARVYLLTPPEYYCPTKRPLSVITSHFIASARHVLRQDMV